MDQSPKGTAAAPHSRFRSLAWTVAFIPPVVVSILIWRYGVDVPVLDQWSMVEDIEKCIAGNWHLHDLIRSHNGHRMMVARLVLVPLAVISGWNTRLEMAVGLIFAAGIWFVLARAVTDRSARLHLTNSYWLVPVASVAVFSLNQWENWLWGIQSFEFMTVFGVSAGLWLLCAPTLSGSRLAASVACGLAASFCKAAGLTFWPVGLIVLALRPRRRRADLVRWFGVWAAAAAMVFAVFSMRVSGDAPGPAPSFSKIAENPLDFVYFVLTLLGAPVVSFLGSAWPPRDLGFGFSAGIVGLSVLVWLAVSHLRRRQWPQGTEAFLFALALYSIGVATQIGIARFSFGAPQAMASRYITHTMPFWISLTSLLALTSVDPRKRRWLAVGALRAASGIIVLLLLIGSAHALPEFQGRFEVLSPAREALGTGQDPTLLARLHPELRQVCGNLGVLQHRRLSVFRDLPPPAAPPARLQPLRDFGQILVAKDPVPRSVTAGEFELTIRVTNPTRETWPHIGDTSGAFAVHLSYRWRTPEGRLVVPDGLRTPIPGELGPGNSVEVIARIQPPSEPGDYHLELSMVQESVAWFSNRQAAPLTINVKVDPRKPLPRVARNPLTVALDDAARRPDVSNFSSGHPHGMVA